MRNSAEPPEPLAIDVRGLTKRFGRRLAVDGLSLALRPTEICGLVGANGGGKSTFLRMLAGLVTPDAGRGSILGYDLLRDAQRIRHTVGYLAQRCTLYAALSVRENLRFRAAMFGCRKPAQVAQMQLSAFGLEEVARIAVAELSGGWSRQVELAAALIHEPRVLLLDEPTVGLDVTARQAIWERLTTLSRNGTCVVVSTHDPLEAGRCTQVLRAAPQGAAL